MTTKNDDEDNVYDAKSQKVNNADGKDNVCDDESQKVNNVDDHDNVCDDKSQLQEGNNNGEGNDSSQEGDSATMRCTVTRGRKICMYNRGALDFIYDEIYKLKNSVIIKITSYVVI